MHCMRSVVRIMQYKYLCQEGKDYIKTSLKISNSGTTCPSITSACIFHLSWTLEIWFAEEFQSALLQGSETTFWMWLLIILLTELYGSLLCWGEIDGMMRDVLQWRSMSTRLTYNTAYINIHSSQDLQCTAKTKEVMLCNRLYCMSIICRVFF